MKLWITKESVIERFARAKQEFFAKEIEVDEELGTKVLEFEEKVRTFRVWLRAVEAAHMGRTPDGIEKAVKEAPEWLNDTKASDAEKPKKQGTAQRSSKTSPTKRKKKATKSATSQKKAE